MERHFDRLMNRHMNIQRHIGIKRLRFGDMCKDRHEQIERHKNSQTDEWAKRQMNRQSDKQIVRQIIGQRQITDRETYEQIERHMNRQRDK